MIITEYHHTIIPAGAHHIIFVYHHHHLPRVTEHGGVVNENEHEKTVL